MNRSLPSRTLLIVDDQAAIRTLLEFVFGVSGYSVVCADSADAAISAATERSFDGVLIDIHMPEVGGFETCDRLRALPLFQAKNPKIWFMTGATNQAVERRAAELGSCGVLKKPFDHDDLLACLQRSLA